MKTVIVAIITGIVLFEVLEHVVFPIIWYVLNRKKRSMSGISGMLGATARVTHWNGKQGRVIYYGEYWTAESDVPLTEGQKVTIESVKGLTLKVKT